MNSKLVAPAKWLEKNSGTLGRKYKDLWLAISSKGVVAKSKSYAQVAGLAEGKNCLLIKVPRNPQAAFAY